jgi:DNA-binding NarL/FixJ family response regulator
VKRVTAFAQSVSLFRHSQQLARSRTRSTNLHSTGFTMQDSSSSTSSSSSSSDLSSCKLMLVDDEAPLRKAVGTYLRGRGYTVAVKESAADALESMQPNKKGELKLPDLIITDVKMPEMDGYAFLKELRSVPALQFIPVIFLTARGMTKDRIQGYRAGANAYLPKPFDPEELVSIVDNLLELNKQRLASIASSSSSSASNSSSNAVTTTSSSDLAELKRELGDIKSLLQRASMSSDMQEGSLLQGSIVLMPGAEPTPAEAAAAEAAATAAAAAAAERRPYELQLIPREQQTLNMICRGYMNKEIAKRLDTTDKNVERLVSSLMKKTGCANRTELAKFAMQAGLRTDVARAKPSSSSSKQR